MSDTPDWSIHARAAIVRRFEDVVVLHGARTPFVDYTGALARISPIDLGIKAGRAAVERSGLDAARIGGTFAASATPASFDHLVMARHVGLYAGVPQDRPALHASRICCTGFELIAQGARAISDGEVEAALCVGAESMSRNPVAAFTHRSGFALGRVEFGDVLFEGLMDTAVSCTMGDTAENLGRLYGASREEVDAYAARSFARALAAQERGDFAAEIVPVVNETFAVPGLNDRSIRLPRGVERVDRDSHVRETSLETLARLKPTFGGVQTAGNSSAIVDGAAGIVLASSRTASGLAPLGRVTAASVIGVPPEIMGVGPVPAIMGLLDRTGLSLDDIDILDINEAFGAQMVACIRALGADPSKWNPNGGAIAFGHPLAATGIRCALSALLHMRRHGLKRGVVGACAGGGQGMALLLEAD